MSAKSLQAALTLSSCGLSVLPIKADGSKKPAIETWKELQESPADEFMIRSWFRNRECGVAVITGVVSGGLEIIDIENPESAKRWVAHISAAGGEELLNRLLVVKTPRGYHMYYRCEQPGPNTDLARRAATAEELKENPKQKYYKLIETRGEHGYALAPGSPAACHKTGLEYSLHRGDFQQIPFITMPERELLLECARSLNEYFVNKEFAEPIATTVDRQTDRPGDLYNERALWAEVLEPLGWRSKTPGRWIRPGGNRDSALEILNGTRLWVFSSSVTELPQEQALSKFAVYTLLNFKGDFASASRELAFKGYVKPEAPKQHQTNFAPPASTETEDDLEEDVPLWPTLPEEAMYGLAGIVARTATEKSEADPAAVLATFLVRAGATFGAKAHFNVGETKHYPRLFSIVVGASSRARKGTSLDPVERIFDAAEKKAQTPDLFVSPGPLSSGEGLIFAVRDPQEKGENTEEDEGVQDKRLMVVESEFGGALRAMQRQGNTLSAVIRAAWDKGNIAPLTKNNHCKTTGAHISLLGHITRQELSDLLDKVEVWNGFANRFLWFCARRSKLIAFPEPMNSDVVSGIATELAASIQHAQQDRAFNFHPEAAACWKKVYPKLTEEVDGIAGNVTSRAEGQVIRLALVYALLDRDDMIRLPHLVAALAVWQYCFASVKYVFAPATTTQDGENSLGNKILEALFNGEKTQADLYIHFQRNVAASVLRGALTSLQAVGRISQRVGEGSGKGGPKPIYWRLALGGDSATS